MNDEELAKIEARYPNDEVHQLTALVRDTREALRKAQLRALPPSIDDLRVVLADELAHATAANREMHESALRRQAGAMREQTAATILAALVVTPAHLRSVDGGTDVERAVALTDALRAALAKGGGQ